MFKIRTKTQQTVVQKLCWKLPYEPDSQGDGKLWGKNSVDLLLKHMRVLELLLPKARLVIPVDTLLTYEVQYQLALLT